MAQPLSRGLLQGTSFSADVFSRVLDFFLKGLLQEWRRSEHEAFRRFALPHALLFADDILLFAASTSEMQCKLRSLQQTLEAIGLRLNFAKCSILNGEDGCTPGVWGRGVAGPLSGTDHLTYLAVPLCYHSSTLGQLGVSLAKTSSAFFALRRLMDHPDTPVKEKLALALFQSYVAWCSPVVYPSARALKSLEAFKHTFLLSLLRIQVDPLQPFLTNVLARRRATKVLCEVHSSERWGAVWLCRLWKFWGHVFRSQAGLPLHDILARCSTRRVVMGRVPAGIVKKLQLAWNHLREDSPVGCIEQLAMDREVWLACLPKWLARWGYSGSVLDKMPDNYLHDRQLLLIGDSLAILRPARIFPEEPYCR